MKQTPEHQTSRGDMVVIAEPRYTYHDGNTTWHITVGMVTNLHRDGSIARVKTFGLYGSDQEPKQPIASLPPVPLESFNGAYRYCVIPRNRFDLEKFLASSFGYVPTAATPEEAFARAKAFLEPFFI